MVVLQCSRLKMFSLVFKIRTAEASKSAVRWVLVVLSVKEGVEGVQQEGAQGETDRDRGQYVEEGGLGHFRLLLG
jgi:hypothetical protein